MGAKVVKFGGSSLADANQFRKVAAIIKADPNRRYVVPSAPGKRFSEDIKVTDLLYQCQSLAAEGVDFSDSFEKIRGRYQEIIAELGVAVSLDSELETIRKNLEMGAGRDYAASRGEYLNGLLLAAYLEFPFVDAAEVMLFDLDGNFLLEQSVAKLRERLSKMDYAVVPGFYGSRENGAVKTFSRGGSDVTGSILANAVKAELYENWTDVSGFLVADPRIVENPEVIRTITYAELRELSYMGATVLHEDAIFPVRSAGIPINIRNTNAPDAPGTMIVSDCDETVDYTITGIAGLKGFSAINIEKAMMNSELGFCRKVLEVLENNQISFEHMPSGIDTTSIILSNASLAEKEQAVLTQIQQAVSPDRVEIEDGIALLAVVGRGMRRTRGTAARIFAALAHARINVKMIDQGSSELNIIIGIHESDFEAAIRCIYEIFVSSTLA